MFDQRFTYNSGYSTLAV